MSIAILRNTIRAYDPATMSEEDSLVLEQMLTMPAFEPLYDVIEGKLEEYFDWIRTHPAFDFTDEKPVERREPRSGPSPKKPENAKHSPPIMVFRQTPSGIIVPVTPSNPK